MIRLETAVVFEAGAISNRVSWDGGNPKQWQSQPHDVLAGHVKSIWVDTIVLIGSPGPHKKNEVRPHGAIVNKPPVAFINCDQAGSPPSQ
jgi:hypothetical protein